MKSLNAVQKITREALPSRCFGSDLTNMNLDQRQKIKRSVPLKNQSQAKNYEDSYLNDIYKFLTFHQQYDMDIQISQNNESQITKQMRIQLLEWIYQIHNRFNFRAQTLFLSINIIDRFCSRCTVTKFEYQLVGLASLFIAGKYEQIDTPYIKQFIQTVDKLYSISDILSMEGRILCNLQFNLTKASSLWYLLQFFHTLTMSKNIKNCQYMIELVLFYCNVEAYQPNYIALAAIQQYHDITSLIKQFKVNKKELKNHSKLLKEILENKDHKIFDVINKKHN